MFGVSYDAVDVLATFAEKYGVRFTLLSDVGSKVIRELGLFNEHVYEHGAAYGIAKRDRHWGVPYPGIFVLDERGIVIDKRFWQSYRERETGTGILERSFGVALPVSGPQAETPGDVVAVRAHLDSDTYRYFQRLWLTVDLDVASGWHVYGEPIPEDYVPLAVEVAPLEGLVIGELEGPAPRPFRIAGLDEEFFVHEGRVRVALPLTFTEKVGDVTLEVTVRYQACSASECLMPAAVPLRLPVAAETHVEWHM